MKYLFFPISIVAMLLMNGCKKNDNIKSRSRYIGYIFNAEDSTPYSNEQFKIYSDYRNLSGSIVEVREVYFYTDSMGHFDVIMSRDSVGNIVGPVTSMELHILVLLT